MTNIFKKAIVRKPGKSIILGLSCAGLGLPDYNLFYKQHGEYINILENICGLDVTVLEANEDYPDSCFVEDVAIVTEKCAVITNPGAGSRKGETEGLEDILGNFYEESDIFRIGISNNFCGCLDGGDIMQVGDEFFIGISGRTNHEGAMELAEYLEPYGYSSKIIEGVSALHLKTGMSYIGDGFLLISDEYVDIIQSTNQMNAFKNFEFVVISNLSEYYVANSVRIQGKLLLASGFEETKRKIENLDGFTGQIVTLDCSEFQKVDGGLSCLSLRF